MLKILKMLGVVMLLCSCGSKKLEFYNDSTPEVDIKEFFNGPIKAWGIVQDWKGNVTRKFDITMVGTWNGDEGVLEEKFEYYDGQTQERIWKIKKLANNKYEGTAGDILDKARGEQNGNAVRWAYTMDLPVGDTTYRLNFDDWMWQMNDGVLINRSYLKKFGITVAELTIFMQKQSK